MHNLWLNKYRPNDTSRFIGNHNNLKKIKNFIIDFNKQNFSSIIISGPHGIGKTLMVDLILNEVNYNSIKLTPLDIKNHKLIEDIFDIKNSFTDKIQEAILLEIEKYRNKFKDGEDGFISKWPEKHNLYGWLICMESGGKLKPHIHENGWLSGSLYINVPKKTKAESGNLVVSLGEEEDEGDNRINQKQIVNVVTGSLVLFPASLTHYTIPFEAKEKRIVLAFDLKKIARQ